MPVKKDPPPKGALVAAVRNWDVALVKELLDQGADPHETDHDGNEAYYIANWEGQWEIAQLIVEAQDRKKEAATQQAHIRLKEEQKKQAAAKTEQDIETLRKKRPPHKSLKN